MMAVNQNKKSVRDSIKKAGSVAVLCSGHGQDAVAAGVALARYIEDRHKKRTVVAYSGDIKAVDIELAEIHEILSRLEDKILKVVIDYGNTDIEKIDYYKQSDSKLVLEIKPVDRNFDVGRIQYEFEGGRYDLFVTVGVTNKNALEAEFKITSKDVSGAEVINIGNSEQNEKFGDINLIDLQAKSLSAIVFRKFVEWKYLPDAMTSKALLFGLSDTSVE